MHLRSILVILAIGLSLCFEPGHGKESYIFSKFQEFVVKHNKKYTTVEEYMERFKIFQSNYNKTERMQISPDNIPSFNLGITKFSDMTPQEFRNTYLNLKVSLKDVIQAKSPAQLTLLEVADVPASHDWRDYGAVGPVKNQGECGSCWSFSAVVNLEGLNFIKNRKFQQFSEQQLVDCDKVDHGCNGGLMEYAFDYIHKSGGIEISKDYPYRGNEGKCKFDKTKVALKVKGFHYAPSPNEEDIKKMLYTTGPLSVALNADVLQYYNDGIIDYDANHCDPQGINHGVAIVGYGNEKGKDFWVVKNSWGPDWGLKGFFKIARGKGTCGINTYVVTAELE
jgi:cathepsin F